MRLLEFEAKRLFSAYGIAVPEGRHYRGDPEGLPCALAGGYVVKAQTREGGRGKRGGVLFADTQAQAVEVARTLLNRRIGSEVVSEVYIEQRLAIATELYVSIAVERDARCHTLVVSPDGGVDIEASPVERRLKQRIEPLLGLCPFMIRRATRFLCPPGGPASSIESLITRLYELVIAEDAKLAEINPVVITGDNRVVAADAKVVLDSNSAFRHPDWSQWSADSGSSGIEKTVGEAGGTAVEIDPDGEIVAVVSGAGLMMATVDLLVDRGARVRCAIDLGGTVLAERHRLVPLLAAVAGLQPAVTFVNAYFQTALADDFAQSVVDACARSPLPGRLIMRLKGRNDGRAAEILAPLGCELHQELRAGIDAAVAAADARHHGHESGRARVAGILTGWTR